MLDSATDYPYIIKPSKGGNSRDITGDSVVHSHQEMAGRIETLIQKYDEVLVESFIGKYSDIREFTVSMIGHGQQMIVAPAEVILKVPKKERLVTTKDKENHLTSAVPITDLLLKKDVSDLASKMFLSADVRDYSRCDILLGGGKLYAIEINGQPMVPDKWFENCLAGAGLDTDQYLNAIFLAGLARNINQGYPALRIPSEMKNLFTSEIYLQLTGQSVL